MKGVIQMLVALNMDFDYIADVQYGCSLFAVGTQQRCTCGCDACFAVDYFILQRCCVVVALHVCHISKRAVNQTTASMVTRSGVA